MLLAGINYKHNSGQLIHIAYAAEVVDKLFLFLIELGLLLFGQQSHLAAVFHLLQRVKACNTGKDGLEIGEHAARPALIYIEHAAAERLLLYGFLRLLFSTYKQHALSFAYRFAHKIIGLFYFLYRFLKIYNIDPVALGKNIRGHLGIPSAGLMSEMDACFQQALH